MLAFSLTEATAPAVGAVKTGSREIIKIEEYLNLHFIKYKFRKMLKISFTYAKCILKINDDVNILYIFGVQNVVLIPR